MAEKFYPRRRGGWGPMTNRDYIAQAGTQCPHCKQRNTQQSTHFSEDNEGVVYRKSWCNDCGEKWEEVYRLAGWQ